MENNKVRFQRIAAAAFLVLAVPAFAASAASVSGVVLNDATNKPIYTAVVTLSTIGTKPLQAAVSTDASGAFRFDNVPPGRYHLWAGNYGFQEVAFGAPTPDRYPAVLVLGAGEVRQGLELRLRPLGAISGVVLDQNGDPLRNAQIQLLVSSWVRGKKTMVRRNGTNSDGRGEFRIGGVLAGHYYLSANAQFSPASETTHPEVSLGEVQPELVIVRMWYPNAARMADARPLEVKPGEEIRNVTLEMITTTAASVHGHIEAPEGVTAGIQVHFVPDEEGGAGLAGLHMAFSPNGDFFTERLAPGHYQVVTALQGSDEYRGVDEVDLRPGPQDVVLHMSKGVALAGRLQVPGVTPGDLSQYTVTLLPGEPQWFGRRMLSATPKGDGTFVFPAVTPGVWDIGVHPIPKGGYVKSMTLGDQDVLTAEMNIGPSTSAPLNIVVSGRGGVIAGVVKMPEDPIADLAGRSSPAILLSPAGRFGDVESFVMVKPAEEGGRYEIRGITPGSYRIFAFDRLEQGAAHDPDFRARVEPLGKAVEIHEGEQISLDLDVLPFVSGEPQQ